MLGAWAGASGALPPAALEAAIEHEFTGNKAKFVPSNIAAFRAGMQEVAR